MLRGHVDKLTRRQVIGWAADSNRPDEPVEVAIFQGEQKIAQIRCERLREDLRKTGHWGSGLHGFLYEFDQPLAEDADHRVSVRHAETGHALGNGEALLPRQGEVKQLPMTTAVQVDEVLRLPAPADPRGLLELFALYDFRYGLNPFLDRIDLVGKTAPEVTFSVFGEFFGTGPSEVNEHEYSARDHLRGLLTSPRFQTNIIPLVLNAFRDKRRLLFVHIPKCAGSDLAHNLMPRYPSLEQRVMDERWTPQPALFAQIADFAREIRFFDSILIRGHLPLNWYIERNLIREEDWLFTILRNPEEIAISQVNYVMTRIKADFQSGRIELDTKKFLEQLGLNRMPHVLPSEIVAEICRRALRNPDIVRPNSMCFWLGGGGAEAVLSRLAAFDAEVTTTAHYNDWLRGRWGIESRSRQNQSVQFVTSELLDADDIQYIRSISTEDLALFRAIQNRLDNARTSSVVCSSGGEDPAPGMAANGPI